MEQVSSALIFDTYAFVKRLTQVGMPVEQAEVLSEEQARLIDNRLATKNDLKRLEERIDNKFEIQRNEIERKFSSMESEMNQRFSSMESEMNQRFSSMESEMNQRFSSMESEMNQRFLSMESKINQLMLQMTIRLGSMMAGIAGVVIAVIKLL